MTVRKQMPRKKAPRPTPAAVAARTVLATPGLVDKLAEALARVQAEETGTRQDECDTCALRRSVRQTCEAVARETEP
jgi:hypothetical protein